MKAIHFGAILMALSGLMAFAVNAGDIEAGKTKSAVCASCHGVDGNSSNAIWPSLAGQHASYLVKQLQDLGYERVTGSGWRRKGDVFQFDLFCGNRIHTTELLPPWRTDSTRF